MRNNSLLPVRYGLPLVLFGIAAWGYFFAFTHYPFYFIWDMDLATVLDVIAIKSGLHPDHVNHPGFGMYFILNLYTWLGEVAGRLSAVSLPELRQTLDPISCVAELTDFVRFLSPLLCLAIAYMLGTALGILLDASLPLLFASWAILLSQSSFLYHSTMNRSELYAVFFWALALWALAKSRHSEKRLSLVGWTVTAGAALGLAFLTKLQVAVYVLLTPVLFLYLVCLCAGKWTTYPKAVRDIPYRPTMLVAVGSAIFFVTTLIISRFTELPQGVWSFTDKYSLTAYGMLFLFFFLAIPLVLFVFRHHDGELAAFPRWLAFLGAGFVGCELLHFLVLPQIGLGWHYMLDNIKMAYLRADLYHPASIAAYKSELLILLRYSPYTLLAHLVALAALLCCGKNVSATTKKIAPVVSLFTVGCAMLSSRPILRDFLWWELLLNVMTLAYGIIAWRHGMRIVRAAVLGVGLVLFLGNLQLDTQVLARLDARYSQYGWQPQPWLRFVFFGAQQRYKEFIQQRYGYTDDTAKTASGPELRQAAHHAAVRRLASFVFPSRKVNLRQVGIAAPGFPLFVSDISLRLTRIPDFLHNAVLVDPDAAPRASGFLPEPPKGEITAEWPLSTYVDNNGLAVLPRADITVWLFEPQAASGDGPVLEASDGHRTVRLVGRKINKFTWLTGEQADGQRVFVLASPYLF